MVSLLRLVLFSLWRARNDRRIGRVLLVAAGLFTACQAAQKRGHDQWCAVALTDVVSRALLKAGFALSEAARLALLRCTRGCGGLDELIVGRVARV